MEANFLRLKQAILSNNVADFDALSSKLAEASEKDGCTVSICAYNLNSDETIFDRGF